MKAGKLRWRAEDEVEDNLREVLPAEAKAYFRAGRKAARKNTDADELHEFRLRSKRFRYLLEFFAPRYGKRLTKPLSSLRKVQTLLGDLNDYVVTRRMMRAEPEADKLHAHLNDLESTRRQEFRSYWKEKFDGDGEEEQWVQMLREPGAVSRKTNARKAGKTDPGRRASKQS